MEKATDAHPLYHVACLFTTVGALVGRRAWVEYGRKLYPNLYTCLVGPAGRGKKSTSINLALEMFPEMPIIRGLSTAEGLLKFLKYKEGHATIVLDEFSGTLMKAKQDSSTSLIPLLTQMYDSPASVESLTKKDPIVVKEPYVSILAATTPDWLEKAMDPMDARGGFASRFLFVWGEPGWSLSSPGMPRYGDLPGRILRKLAVLPDEGRRFLLDGEAQEVWDKIFEGLMQKATGVDPLTDSLLVRTPQKVRKVALLIHLLQDGVGSITWETLAAANRFVEMVEERIFDTRAVFSPVSEKVMARFEKAGAQGIYLSRLQRDLSGIIDVSRLGQYVSGLLRFGRIEKMQDGEERYRVRREAK